jgi:hypothetical protein
MADTDRALQECLHALREGRKLNDILQRHPRERDELISLLQVAVDVGGLQPPAADPRFKLRARNQMLALAARNRIQHPSRPWPLPRLVARPAIRFGAAAALGFAVMGGAIGAAANSQPGDPLYGLRTAIEKTQIALTFDAQSRDHLRQQYAAHRLDEASRLATEGRISDAIALVDQAGQEVADSNAARVAWTVRAEARVDQLARKSAAVRGQPAPASHAGSGKTHAASSPPAH